jgi:hypothetical protein
MVNMAFSNFCNTVYRNLASVQNFALILVFDKTVHHIIVNIFQGVFLNFTLDNYVLAEDGKDENSKS